MLINVIIVNKPKTLTVRSDEVERVVGLELGADDYRAKPFSMRELIARVKALLVPTTGYREK